jgi:hypothetical protein
MGWFYRVFWGTRDNRRGTIIFLLIVLGLILVGVYSKEIKIFLINLWVGFLWPIAQFIIVLAIIFWGLSIMLGKNPFKKGK